MNDQSYGVSPEAYLARARDRLLDRTCEGLFYAAFELRCFVEARQNEYLEAQRQYARSVPSAFHIGKQGKALEAIFASDRIQQIEWFVKGVDAIAFSACHVPVDAALRNGAERLGDLLHQQDRWRAADDPWWTATRRTLLDLYGRAWTCNKGLLLSPVFVKNEGQLLGNVVMKIAGHEAEMFAENTRKGTVGVMRVEYLSGPPSDWILDLPE